MQAIVHDRYGSLELLAPRGIEPPTPREGEVLVRVIRAAIHPGDLFAVKGSPFPVRFMTGLRRPKRGVPGFDLAGIVEAVGPGVRRFRPGDEVLGCGAGSCAEYATAREADLVAKPPAVGWDAAAALPTSGLAALHGLRAAGLLERQRVLINGASGGVGTFQVQLARGMGADVTAVCSTDNVALMGELGATSVIDRTVTDFTAAGTWDVIIDNVENRSLADVRRALTPTGTLVLNSGTGAGGLRMLIRLVAPVLRSRFSRQTLRRYLSSPNTADLELLAGMVERGSLRTVIGGRHPLRETEAALRVIESGRARGKLVIEVAPAPAA